MTTYFISVTVAFGLVYAIHWFEDVKFMNRRFDTRRALIRSSLFSLGGPVTVAGALVTIALLSSFFISMAIKKRTV